MVQKNSTIRPVRSKNTVVEFGIEVPDEIKKTTPVKAKKVVPKRIKEFLSKAKVDTYAQARRRPPQEGQSSKYKGVHKRAYDKGKHVYFDSYITYAGKEYCLFRAPVATPGAEKDAARAYDKAALELWGDEALTNAEYFGDL